MKDRKEVEKINGLIESDARMSLILEVLLDIRELIATTEVLKHIERKIKSK